MNTSVEQLLREARKRLRRRSIWKWIGLFFWGGAVSALATGLLSRLWWPWSSASPWLVMLGILALALLTGALIGALRPILNARELALLLDRSLKTDEVIVTQLFLEESGRAGEHPEIVADLDRRISALPAIKQSLPSGSWRGVSWPALLALIAALALLIPQREGAVPKPDPGEKSLTEEQAEELEETLEELEEKFEEKLPEEIEEDIESLVENLRDGSLSPEEALEQIQELQESLDDFEQEMADSADAMDELAEAAEELAKDNATQDLADAMENADMDAAEDALDKMMEQLQNGSKEEQQEAGEALEQAGEQLSNSSNEQLKEMGEQMKQAGESLQQQSQGQPGTEQQTQQAMEDLKERMRQNQELAEQLKSDEEKLQRSQELNGALEGASQEMGGEPGVDEGQSAQEAQAGEGQAGEGQAGEPGNGTQPGLGSEHGSGHTWEDEGTHDTQGGHRDENRLSNRTEGMEADDFEQFYAPIRMEGAEGAMSGVTGEIDESGHMESLPSRLTEGDEVASRPLLDVPDGYRDAAERAMENERVPPGYRNSVRQYFESVE